LDTNAQTQKLFKRLDAEITAFIALLSAIAHDPKNLDHQSKATHQLRKLMGTAKEIGGDLFEDVERLKKDFYEYLSKTVNLEKIQQDALRIKHEVRPL